MTGTLSCACLAPSTLDAWLTGALADVLAARLHALREPAEVTGVFALPGPKPARALQYCDPTEP